MVGRFFIILVIISSGASYYLFAPDYFTPKVTSSITILLDDSMFVEKYFPQEVASDLPPPTIPTLKEYFSEISTPKPSLTNSFNTSSARPPLPPVIVPIKTIPKKPKTKKLKTRLVDKGTPVPTKKNPRHEAPPIPVHSYGNNVVVPLKNWKQATIITGNVDQVLIDGPERLDLGTRPLTNNDVLQISGWAGNTSHGMQMHYVLISMCKRVIGHTLILDRRQDIADRIHPNLILSGWTAWIAVAHLPRCEDSRLRFWAIEKNTTKLSPLTNSYKINLPTNPIEPGVSFYTEGSPLKLDRF
jgi:hypothetical protein